MKSLAFAGALALALSGCSASQNAALIQTTQNLVALNNALVQVNTTLINNFVAQSKLLAPYTCGGYALASAIVEGSPAATTVNNYISKSEVRRCGPRDRRRLGYLRRARLPDHRHGAGGNAGDRRRADLLRWPPPSSLSSSPR